jgi:nucleotidyltransferase substrate binding protein (TIGR01987 family)
MKELEKRYVKLLEVYKYFSYTSEKFPKSSDEINKLVVYCDALIRRFHICYDLTWKFLKLLLRERHAIEANSPRTVFLECYRQKILTEQESGELFNMLDDRNETAHIYDERKIDIISARILDHYKILDAIVKKIKIDELYNYNYFNCCITITYR